MKTRYERAVCVPIQTIIDVASRQERRRGRDGGGGGGVLARRTALGRDRIASARLPTRRRRTPLLNPRGDARRVDRGRAARARVVEGGRSRSNVRGQDGRKALDWFHVCLCAAGVLGDRHVLSRGSSSRVLFGFRRRTSRSSPACSGPTTAVWAGRAGRRPSSPR